MTSKAEIQLNGVEAKQLTVHEMPPSEVQLSAAQERHLSRLITLLGRAQDAQEAAQKALEAAKGNANGFLDYCAEELGAVGYRFDQMWMAFVRPEPVQQEDTDA